MATLDDAIRLIERDPVIGFVSIPVIASQPPAKSIVLRLKGQNLQLPDWSVANWRWYGDLALKIAAKQTAANPTGEADKSRAIARLRPLLDAMGLLADDDASAAPPIERVGPFYDAAVRVVIASNAAAFGPSRGRLAAEAFGAAVVELPGNLAREFLEMLKFITSDGTSKIVNSAAEILRAIFGGAASGLSAALQNPTVLIIGGLVAAYWWSQRNRKGE